MLDTVLQIGKTFRNSPDGFRYHRYIFSLSEKEKEKVAFYSIPVLEDYSFDLNNCTPIMNENLKQKLYFLKFKTSDQDGAIKYIYGDIYYGLNKNGKEFGNYRITIDAFENGVKYLKGSKNEALLKFTDSFRKNKNDIHNLLRSIKTIFLHFDFDNRHWYETDALDEINKIMISNFTNTVEKDGHKD